jgi:hypothetical protein
MMALPSAGPNTLDADPIRLSLGLFSDNPAAAGFCADLNGPAERANDPATG